MSYRRLAIGLLVGFVLGLAGTVYAGYTHAPVELKPPVYAFLPLGAPTNQAAVTTTASVTVVAGSCYLLSCDAKAHYRITAGASSAVTTDRACAADATCRFCVAATGNTLSWVAHSGTANCTLDKLGAEF